MLVYPDTLIISLYGKWTDPNLNMLESETAIKMAEEPEVSEYRIYDNHCSHALVKLIKTSLAGRHICLISACSNCKIQKSSSEVVELASISSKPSPVTHKHTRLTMFIRKCY